jgi:hypothetical protein
MANALRESSFCFSLSSMRESQLTFLESELDSASLGVACSPMISMR